MALRKQNRVVLPGLELNRIEYDILEGLATKEGMRVAEYVEALVRDAIEIDEARADGKVVVLQIPEDAHRVFAAWVLDGDESAEDAMARFIASEAARLVDLQAQIDKMHAKHMSKGRPLGTSREQVGK